MARLAIRDRVVDSKMAGEYDRLAAADQPYRGRQVEALVGKKMDELEGGSRWPVIAVRSSSAAKVDS